MADATPSTDRQRLTSEAHQAASEMGGDDLGIVILELADSDGGDWEDRVEVTLTQDPDALEVDVVSDVLARELTRTIRRRAYDLHKSQIQASLGSAAQKDDDVGGIYVHYVGAAALRPDLPLELD